MVLSKKSIVANLSVYGIAHGLVDCISAALVFNLLAIGTSFDFFVWLAVLYNVLAFGLQVPIGIVIDKIKIPKFSAIFGFILAILAIILYQNPLVSITLIGIGNALFHIGGGIISLNLTPKKATAPGIFVAPGAIGLLIGTLIGKTGNFSTSFFVLASVIAIVIILAIKIPKINFDKKELKINYFEIALMLILFSIAIRAFIGSVLIFPWKSNLNLLWILTIAVFLGKGFGGIIGDRFGWVKTATISLAVSSLLLLFPQNYWVAIIGMFLFNMTMPIALVAVANMFPGRPGFSFGINCLALLLGSLAVLLGYKFAVDSLRTLLIILVSTFSIYLGLRISKQN